MFVEPSDEGLIVADNPQRSRYEATIGTVIAAFSDYRLVRGRIVFIHTEVAPGFEGRGIGSPLARGLLDDTRARGLKVTPRCEFIAAYIERHPEYADLVSWGPFRRPVPEDLTESRGGPKVCGDRRHGRIDDRSEGPEPLCENGR